MRVARPPLSAACAAAMLVLSGEAGAAAPARNIGCSDAGETNALGFVSAALVTDNKSEADDVHLKKDAYRLGEPFRIFLVPAGYACAQEKGAYKARFTLSVQLIYRGDVAVDQPNIKDFDFSSEEKIKVVRINLDDTITGLVPGAFAFKVTLVDTIGGRPADVILPFTIAE